MHNLTFPMLGTISSVEITQDSPAEDALNKLRDAIADKLVKALQATSFIEKGKFIHAIEHCLNDARTLCNFPQLLGRPLVAIVPADASANQIIAPLADFEPAWNTQITLPRLLTQAAGQPGIEVISATGKPVNLKDLPGHNSLTPYRLEGEELKVLLNLPEDGIDPRSLCRGLHCQVNLKPSNMAFLILPPQEFGKADSGKLLAHCDAVIVLGKMANQKSLKVLRNNFNMPVYFLTNSNVDDEIRYLQSRYAGREIVHKSPGDFWQLLQTLDTPTQRITLKDRLLAEILAIEEDLANQIQGRKALMNKLQRDNTLFAGDRIGLGEILEAMRKSIHQDIQNLNKQKADFSRAAEEVLDAAKAVEKLIQEGQAHKEHNSHAKLSSGVMRPGSLWRRIILRSLVAGYPMQAAEYQDKFEGMYPKDAFLTRMYLENQKGHKPGKQEIEQLRHLPDSPEALRAKIFFRNELGLSEDDCINIAAILPRPKSADECYFWALHNYAKYQDAKKNSRQERPHF